MTIIINENERFFIYNEIIGLKLYWIEPIIKKFNNKKLIGDIPHNENLQYGHHYSNIKIDINYNEFKDLFITKIIDFVNTIF